MNAKQLKENAERLFQKRSQFMSLCQEIAENFYCERADFTVRRDVGDEYAENLMSSYPLQARRDLGDQIGSMLRPAGKEWFHFSLLDGEGEDNDAKRWLENAAAVQRRAMYDRKSMFEKACMQADHDFAAFGQAVMSIRPNRSLERLMFRTWHIRDVVWSEDEEGKIDFVARKWRPTARTLVQYFPATVDPKIRKAAEKTPFEEYDCMHICCSSDMFDGKTNQPYVSIQYDCTNNKPLEEMPTWNKEYIIPRWLTVSGSQYAYSPATIIALPDARLIQAMTFTLLEAGEKATRPPIIATQDAVRSDVDLASGGITWVDYEYDERFGEALRPIPLDLKGMPIGMDMARDTREMLARAFFLNKLNLPRTDGKERTAYEISQMIQEYIRGAMPIFAPMEPEYNGAMTELVFEIMFRFGAFGSPLEMPESLRGRDVQARFSSPLHDLIEQVKGQQWLEAKAILADAAAIDQSAIALVDAKVALRDVLAGIGIPSKWVRSEVTVAQIEEQQRAAAQAQQTLAAMQQGAATAKDLGAATKDFAASEAV